MSTKLKRQLIVGTASLVGIAVGLVVANHWMSSDSTGTVHVSNPSATRAVPTPQPVSLSSTYFSTTLPAGFTIKRQVESSNSDRLYSALALTPSAQDLQVAVTAAQLPSDGLAGVGDYHLRTSQADTYAPYTLPRAPNGSSVFRTRSGASAFTLFWPHGSIYVELAFSTSGGASLDQLVSAYEQVLSTWQWK